jgi:hypothetical protein
MASTTTDRRFGVNVGQAIKVPCRVASTANLDLSGLDTVDGVELSAEDRVLAKNQTAGAENGIWVVQSGAWIRTPDFDGTYDVKSGTMVMLSEGDTQADTLWYLATADPITIDTSELTFYKMGTGEGSPPVGSGGSAGIGGLTDNKLTRANGTDDVQDAAWTCDDSGNITPDSTGQKIRDFEYSGYFETVQTVTSTTAGGLSFSLANGNVIYHALTQNTTMLPPTDLTTTSSKAQSWTMEITQPGTNGYTVSYTTVSAAYDFGGGSTHSMSTGAGDTDILTFVARGSTATAPVIRSIVALTAGSSHA